MKIKADQQVFTTDKQVNLRAELGRISASAAPKKEEGEKAKVLDAEHEPGKHLHLTIYAPMEPNGIEVVGRYVATLDRGMTGRQFVEEALAADGSLSKMIPKGVSIILDVYEDVPD